MSIGRVQDVFFDDKATLAMGEAFDHACAALDRREIPVEVRTVIAKRIIWAANDGERDPGRLCEKALVPFGIEDMSTVVANADCGSPTATDASVTRAAWPESAPPYVIAPRRIEAGR